MSLAFRYAAYDEYGRISQFLDRYWAKNHVYVRMPELFDWTFGPKDVWDGEGYSFAIAEDSSQIIGILGAIPFTFNCFGKQSPAVWLANYMLCPPLVSIPP